MYSIKAKGLHFRHKLSETELYPVVTSEVGKLLSLFGVSFFLIYEMKMNNKLLLKKTQIVMLITLITMIGEIFFGYKTHSMSLLADGFHMGTHEVAFIITAIVCYLSIKYQNNEKNLEALGGYTSAILLGLTAIAIISESIDRFFNSLSLFVFSPILP